jgi:putative hydrolase of the HAD superfamily
MAETSVEIFRQHSAPLEPQPTGESSRLVRLPGIRAVFFDVYGTMFVSGSGDLGTANNASSTEAMGRALEACGVTYRGPAQLPIDLVYQAIERTHKRLRADGIDYPEVDIVEIWSEVVAELAERNLIDKRAWGGDELKCLAAHYEARANPVWPMPGLLACLDRLRKARIVLGIISNAQFFTIELFPALLGKRVEELGFDPQLQYYSCRHHRAKPGTFLHQQAERVLEARGIKPREALYVGNDLLNDVLPAFKLGFRTALFAGDGRSLRWRKDDPRVTGVTPDLVITHLAELELIIAE